MNAITSAMPQFPSDEIDLAALFRALWKQKLLIVSVTLLVGMLAAAYAFLATPEYQVQSVLRPALIKDLDELNRTGVYTLTPAKAMQRVGAPWSLTKVALSSFAPTRACSKAFVGPVAASSKPSKVSTNKPSRCSSPTRRRPTT